MPRNRLSSVLAALSVVGSSALAAPIIAPIATAQIEQEAQTPTAHLYDTYFQDGVIRGEQTLERQLRSNAPLPEGTEFELIGANPEDSYVKTEEVSIFFDETSRTLTIDPNLENATHLGISGTAEVLVTFPDKSTRVASARYTFYAWHATTAQPEYSDTTIRPGATTKFRQDGPGYFPDKTLYSILSNPVPGDPQDQGWKFEIDAAQGNITVTAPETVGATAQIPVLVSYPDGSFEIVELDITVTDPHADVPTPIRGGSSLSSF